MAPSRRRRCGKLEKIVFSEHTAQLITLFVGGAIASSGNSALAQLNLTPDTAVDRNLGTRVEPLAPLVNQIQGGTQQGSNLFHSFLEFNVRQGRSVYFENPAGVTNILSRVTGNDPSNILGTLGVGAPGALGRANLFLINPNGIIFGQNARLDVGGSFVATTANAIAFGNQGFFSASQPNAPPLLTLNPSAFLFNQLAAQPINSIEVRGTLAVPNNQSLLLIGGNISVTPTSTGSILLNGGRLQAPGGRVELSSIAGLGTVGLNVDGSELSLSFPVDIARADVSLTNGAQVSVRAGGGGSIAINAQNLNLEGGSQLQAGIASGLGSVDSKAGDIEINTTGTITLTGATSLTQRSSIANLVESEAKGRGGDIHITTGSLFVTDGGELITSTFGQGNAGDVTIDARNTVEFRGGKTVGRDFASSLAYSRVERTGDGRAGDIQIKTGSLLVTDGAFLSSSTLGQGDAGSVTIDAHDTVIFDGVGLADDTSSGAYSQVLEGGVGNGGHVTITARLLSLTNGAVVSTSTLGKGDAGSVTIDADTVIFDGVGSDGTPSGAYSRVRDEAVGNGGNVTITARWLSLTNGAGVSTSTLGKGDAGSVTIDARDTVIFDGVGSHGIPSGAYSQVRERGVGNGGNVTITTRWLSLTNGAAVSTSTLGKGDAGSVTINQADTVFLDGKGNNSASGLFAMTRSSSDAGELTINTRQLIVQNGAQVSAKTFGAGSAGTLVVNATESVTVDGKDSALNFDTLSRRRNAGDAGDLRIFTRQLVVQNGAKVSARTSGAGDAGTLLVNATESVRVDGKGSSLTFDTSGAGNAQGIRIETGQLVVENGGQVTVSGTGSGNPGNLDVAAGAIALNNQGKLVTTTESGEGGNIGLQVQDEIRLRHNSLISASAEGTGNGGNINIQVPNGFVLAILSENSDIVASAKQGNGGIARATATGVFGFRQFRFRRTPESDFTTSSEFGIDGTLEINTRDNLEVPLPAEFVDASRLIDQRCQRRGGQDGEQNKFIITGRGGLPPSPNQSLQGESVITNWVRLDPQGENRSGSDSSSNPDSSTADQTSVPKTPVLVEAQGWVINDKGEVVLTASAPTATPQSPSVTPAGCPGL